MHHEKKILVTGATGYIGRKFIKAALIHQYTVLALSRRYERSLNTSWIHFDLHDPILPLLPSDITTIVHLAVDSSLSNAQINQHEVQCAKQLLTFSQKIKAKFIFISSQSARENALTSYARTKWHIEQLVHAAGGWVVKAGFVYGGAPRGLFGVLVRYARALPILPAFYPAPKIQLLHVDDLAEGLVRLIKLENTEPHIVHLAETNPISFHRFLSCIASERLRRVRIFLPIPFCFVSITLIFLRKCTVKPTIIERLYGLSQLPLMSTEADLKRLNLSLRHYTSGMHISGNAQKRHLLQEGYAMMHYLLKKEPNKYSLRQYVRVVESMTDNLSLKLPKLVLKYPILLALLDTSTEQKKQPRSIFSQRLHIATLLTEASIQGSDRYLHCRMPSSRFYVIMLLFFSGFNELCWRMLSFCFTWPKKRKRKI